MTDPNDLPRPARYFPVRRAPLRIEAGLRRFGTDFGNGEADRLYFQRDREVARYLAAKAATPPGRHGVLARDAAERRVHRRVQEWMHAQLALVRAVGDAVHEIAEVLAERHLRII